MDAAGIAAAHIDSIRSLGARSYPAEIVEEWAAPRSGALYERAMEKQEVFFVAIEAGAQTEECEQILGFSSYRVLDGKHRTAVYVTGYAARGGVGTALFRAAEAAARDNGGTEIEIDASLCAVDFYLANGFEISGMGEHKLKSGSKMACIFMKKRLGGRPGDPKAIPRPGQK